MGYIWSLALIVCGVLAASTLIISKKPNAKELIDKLVPVQGWIGAVVCVIGIWAVIRMLLNIQLLSIIPIHWIIFLAMGVTMALLGFLLGFGLISQYTLQGNPEAAGEADINTGSAGAGGDCARHSGFFDELRSLMKISGIQIDKRAPLDAEPSLISGGPLSSPPAYTLP